MTHDGDANVRERRHNRHDAQAAKVLAKIAGVVVDG